MALIETKRYQEALANALCSAFGSNVPIRLEWSSRKGASDGFAALDRYSPKPDIAVGPFNAAPRDNGNAEEIFGAASHWLVRKIAKRSHCITNENPRCLLAIETDFSGSSKHILGSFTNVSMLGLIGVIITSDQTREKVDRITKYIDWVWEKRKGPVPGSLFGNVAVFGDAEFLDLVLSGPRRG